MIDNYSHEHLVASRGAELGRRLELLRHVHAAEIPPVRGGLRAGIALFLRQTADRIESSPARRELNAG